MYAVLALGIVAFTLCMILTPICRDIFLRLDIVDQPDTIRKFHGKPIPRIGGIPIALSYATALLLMLAFAPHGARIFVQHQRLMWSLLPAAGLVFATGLVDDLIGLKPWQKLIGQGAAAGLAISLGARITLFHGAPASPWLTIPLSVLWLIICTNAFNLIDGMDGLAAGVGLFATVTTLLAAVLQGNIGLAVATVPLVGCLLAFLRYNFSPASIFLGDGGSLTIGFMLGCFGLIWSQKSATLLGMAAPLMAFALPLLDVSLSIGRRFLRREPIFKADRGHIHHKILALGFKTRDAALILYTFCGIAAILSLLQSVVSFQFRGLSIIIFCSLSWIGISCLGYVEFRAARRIFSQKTVRRVLKEEIYLEDLRRSLGKASSLDDCWTIVRGSCEELRFASVQMFLQGHTFEEIFDSTRSETSWQMTLSLGRKGHLSLTRVSDIQSPTLMMSVLHLLQEGIRNKEFILHTSQRTSMGTRIVSGAA